MGALRNESTKNGSDRPPSSESRPLQSRLNDTDPSMPPPDPNRPVVRARSERVRRPAEAGPDSLEAPEYVGPTPPPPETEHKTFELQTVKIMPEVDGEARPRSEDPEERNPDPGLRQADIPTVLSTRIQRRRTWTMGLVLVVLGVAAGVGILVLAQVAQVEPVSGDPTAAESAAESATVTHSGAMTVSDVVVPAESSSAVAVPLPSEPSIEPVPPVTDVDLTPKKVPVVTPTSKSAALPDAAASTKSTTSIPLGPPEF